MSVERRILRRRSASLSPSHSRAHVRARPFRVPGGKTGLRRCRVFVSCDTQASDIASCNRGASAVSTRLVAPSHGAPGVGWRRERDGALPVDPLAPPAAGVTIEAPTGSPTGVRAVHTASGPGGRRRKGLEPSRRLSETTGPRSPSAFRIVFPTAKVTKRGASGRRHSSDIAHRIRCTGRFVTVAHKRCLTCSAEQRSAAHITATSAARVRWAEGATFPVLPHRIVTGRMNGPRRRSDAVRDGAAVQAARMTGMPNFVASGSR